MEARRPRKIVAGRAEKNLGISVARPDGLSKAAICRATELPDTHNGAAHAKAKAKTAAPDGSVKAALDINQLSPVEALTKLYELQRRVTGMYQNHEVKRGAKI